MHNQYSPLWKCSKLIIPTQTDGMIRFCFNIGCSESKVIFKWRRTKTTHKGKKAFREANVHTLCISFSLSQNSLSDKQTQSNTVNTQKSPPWACDKRCAEACAERFSALKSAGYKFWTAWAFVFSWTGEEGGWSSDRLPVCASFHLKSRKCNNRQERSVRRNHFGCPFTSAVGSHGKNSW